MPRDPRRRTFLDDPWVGGGHFGSVAFSPPHDAWQFSVHAVVDYLVGILLIAAPWLLGFANGGPAQIVPVALGIGVILYSLLTAYELGLWPVIPMSGHLMLDAAGGIFLAASPWLFQFSDVIWWPHVVVGVGEVLAAVLTETAPRHMRSTLASGRHSAPRA